MHTTKVQGIPKPLLPYELDIGFAPLIEFTSISHLVRFLISGTEEMGHTHGPLDIFDIFTAMLRDSAINGSAPVKVLDPRDT